MKAHVRSGFGEVLNRLAVINSRALARKAELAAGLAWHYPHRQHELHKIEQSARHQLQAIAGLSFGTATAMD